ncbi:MAG: murein biosynthesis integral membrane protein MurJ [Anaerolineales bacterium]|nr:murein biosynthesis integral membrane protein MurJ [Anaerolineales bacterium]
MDTSQRQINRAAITVMAAFLLSNLTGLARQILIADAFGTSRALDAFNTAQRIPDLLFNLVAGGALASAFVPAFTGFLTRTDRAGAWRLASGVMTLAALSLAVISALAAALAPAIIGLIGAGLPPTEQALAAGLLRVLLLAPTIFGVSGLLMGILNAHQHFLLPALAPTFYWLGMITGLLLWVPAYGIYGLAWGAVLGAGLHLAVQLPGLRGLPERRLRPAFSWSDPAVREVLRLMGPRLLGVAAVQLNFLVNTALATFLPGGASALDYAWRIFTMPQVIIAQGIAIAALPAFSAMAARGEINAMRTSLADTLRLVLFLTLPATVGLLLLGQPVTALFFQRGSFDAASTALVAWPLACYTLGLVSHSVVEIVARAYYALKDTWTPVWVGAAAMGLNILLNFALADGFTRLGWPAHAGLALANTLATTGEMVVLAWLMRRRLDGLALTRIWPGLWRAALAAAGMGAGLLVWSSQTAGASPWLAGLGGVAAGAGLFWLSAYALRSPEARQFTDLALRRLSGLLKRTG